MAYASASFMAIKAVFFDAAGTLIRPTKPVGESYAVLAKKYSKDVPTAEIRERFHSCFSSAPPLAFPEVSSEELLGLERAWWKDLVRRVFEPWGPFARFDEYFSELFRYFSSPDSWSLYPETMETLSLLKERRIVLAVISNFDSRLLGILNGLGIDSWFDSILLSSRVGHAKPDPEIFHAALRLHGLKPEEALHVGDSREKDAAGANHAGLIGVLLDRNSRVPKDSFPKIRSLKEIVRLTEQGG